MGLRRNRKGIDPVLPSSTQSLLPRLTRRTEGRAAKNTRPKAIRERPSRYGTLLIACANLKPS